MAVAEGVAPGAVVRPPMQGRSREAWDRILESAYDILVTDGRSALTIAAVCSQANVAPTAIYARVDGIAGLFWALYEWRMTEVVATQERLFSEAEQYPADTDARIDAAVRAVATTFRDHDAFLHPIINVASSDPAMRARGAETSLELFDRLVGLLSVRRPQAAGDTARMIQQEAIMRSMYGDAWLSHDRETFEDFVSRVARMARARFAAADEGGDTPSRRKSGESAR